MSKAHLFPALAAPETDPRYEEERRLRRSFLASYRRTRSRAFPPLAAGWFACAVVVAVLLSLAL